MVPFSMLWVVLQRYGFLIKRQRIGLAYQPDVLHESQALRCRYVCVRMSHTAMCVSSSYLHVVSYHVYY